MPSLFEGFSIALLEAMAIALPIIATDVGGNAEAIINDKSGVIIPDKNINSLVEAIEYAYNNNIKTKEMGLNARKRFDQNFTIQRMMTSLDSIYSSQVINL